MAVEHLYCLTGNEQFVFPFNFFYLLLFTVTNSKLALSVVSKILPCGSYSTFTSWRDSMTSNQSPFTSGDCITVFGNDQIVQLKVESESGAKSRREYNF